MGPETYQDSVQENNTSYDDKLNDITKILNPEETETFNNMIKQIVNEKKFPKFITNDKKEYFIDINQFGTDFFETIIVSSWCDHIIKTFGFLILENLNPNFFSNIFNMELDSINLDVHVKYTIEKCVESMNAFENEKKNKFHTILKICMLLTKKDGDTELNTILTDYIPKLNFDNSVESLKEDLKKLHPNISEKFSEIFLGENTYTIDIIRMIQRMYIHIDPQFFFKIIKDGGLIKKIYEITHKIIIKGHKPYKIQLKEELLQDKKFVDIHTLETICLPKSLKFLYDDVHYVNHDLLLSVPTDTEITKYIKNRSTRYILKSEKKMDIYASAKALSYVPELENEYSTGSEISNYYKKNSNYKHILKNAGESIIQDKLFCNFCKNDRPKFVQKKTGIMYCSKFCFKTQNN
jgi:hypothetical protein